MICSHCATEMPEISAFCPRCGRSVSAEPAVEISAHMAFNTTDIRESILGALAYFMVIPAIVFLAVPALRQNAFVRFHAWQSVLFAVSTVIIAGLMRIVFAILSFVPFIGILFAWLAAGLVFLALVMLWAVLVVKAGQGDAYELPWLGHFAARLTAPHAE